MEKLAEQNKLLILDPLDKNERVRLLDQIIATTPIYNPKKSFNLNLSERSLA